MDENVDQVLRREHLPLSLLDQRRGQAARAGNPDASAIGREGHADGVSTRHSVLLREGLPLVGLGGKVGDSALAEGPDAAVGVPPQQIAIARRQAMPGGVNRRGLGCIAGILIADNAGTGGHEKAVVQDENVANVVGPALDEPMKLGHVGLRVDEALPVLGVNLPGSR